MARNLQPLTLVATKDGTYGVILGRTPDVPYEEYRVQLVETNDRAYTTGFQGLFNADEIVPVGFCANDHVQALVLCAAAGVAFHSGDSYAA